MRRNPALPQARDKLLLLIELVGSQRDALPPAPPLSHLVQHGQGRLPLRRRTGLRGPRCHYQPMPVLDDHMPQITGLGLARRALLIQTRVRVAARLMGVAQTLLAARSRALSGRRILGLETIAIGPGLQQRSIHREML